MGRACKGAVLACPGYLDCPPELPERCASASGRGTATSYTPLGGAVEEPRGDRACWRGVPFPRMEAWRTQRPQKPMARAGGVVRESGMYPQLLLEPSDHTSCCTAVPHHWACLASRGHPERFLVPATSETRAKPLSRHWGSSQCQ